MLFRSLSGISEAKPLLSVLDSQPVYVVGATVPAILALAAALHAAWRNHGLVRSGWLILALMLAVILAVAFVQVRSIRITAAFLAPACAYWVVLARTRYLARTTIGTVLGLVGAWLGFAGVVWAGLAFLVGNALPSPAASEPPTVAVDRGACVAPAAYADLLGMPSTRIMTPVDLGAYVLLYTEHAVVSAPYHRNNRGLLDTFAFFNQPLEQGRAILDERGITLVVTCFALPEMEGIPEANEDSFVRLAARDALPDWLEEISDPEAPLTIYRVQPR